MQFIAKLKAGLAAEIAYDANFHGWTQREVGGRTGLTQNDVSLLLRGKRLDRFTIDRLLMVLIVLGHQPRILVA